MTGCETKTRQIKNPAADVIALFGLEFVVKLHRSGLSLPFKGQQPKEGPGLWCHQRPAGWLGTGRGGKTGAGFS